MDYKIKLSNFHCGFYPTLITVSGWFFLKTPKSCFHSLFPVSFGSHQLHLHSSCQIPLPPHLTNLHQPTLTLLLSSGLIPALSLIRVPSRSTPYNCLYHLPLRTAMPQASLLFFICILSSPGKGSIRSSRQGLPNIYL